MPAKEISLIIFFFSFNVPPIIVEKKLVLLKCFTNNSTKTEKEKKEKEISFTTRNALHLEHLSYMTGIWD